MNEPRTTAPPTPFRNADRGVLLYGLTPPRRTTTPERADEIARLTLARLAPLDLDALILYDVDAEADRSPGNRPFPFLPMMDPATYLETHLHDWTGPAIVYRAVGTYPPQDLTAWLTCADPDRILTVLVGAASRHQTVRTRLDHAYHLRSRHAPHLPLGGVTIAERHARRGDEHHRMLRKQDAGCTFFISQICYDLDHTRDLLSDYVHTCRHDGRTPQPVVITLAPCGSAKTLDFMTWLGIEIPRWVRNDITHSTDPLQQTYDHCLDSARALITFCRRLQLPFGLNVESITNRKIEIEASVALAHEIHGLLRNHPHTPHTDHPVGGQP